MNRWSDRLLGVLVAVSAIGLLGYGYIWWVSSANLAKTYAAPLLEVALSDDPEVLAEGERLAWTRGCFWCHGRQLQGAVYYIAGFKGVKLTAPNLTWKARDYTTAEFVRALRHGIRPDGTSLQPAMPSFAYYHLSDQDLTALMSYIKSLPVVDGIAGEWTYYPYGHIRYALGEFPPNTAELIDHAAPRVSADFEPGSAAHGEYLVKSTCEACHSDLGRYRVPVAPNLQIGKAYSEENLDRLLRTGIALGEREIDYQMVEVAQHRYIYLTSDEVTALYQYFKSM
jgi:cytochrome c553